MHAKDTEKAGAAAGTGLRIRVGSLELRTSAKRAAVLIAVAALLAVSAAAYNWHLSELEKGMNMPVRVSVEVCQPDMVVPSGNMTGRIYVSFNMTVKKSLDWVGSCCIFSYDERGMTLGNCTDAGHEGKYYFSNSDVASAGAISI